MSGIDTAATLFGRTDGCRRSLTTASRQAVVKAEFAADADDPAGKNIVARLMAK